MSATDELRRMLDERGVEWVDGFTINMLPITGWMHGDIAYTATQISGKLKLAVVKTVTPEQAVKVTLGRRKCTICDNTCSVCGGGISDCDNYCPVCGSEVEDVISQ